MNFKKMKPGDLSLTFFIDGTGATAHRSDVQTQGRRVPGRLPATMGPFIDRTISRLPGGTLQVKRCVLKSASIAYKLFKSDGIPLRVVITTRPSPITLMTRPASRWAQDESPDLTHIRLVKAGDNLPALCSKIL